MRPRINYDHVLMLLVRRYVGQEDKCYCRECGLNYGYHDDRCECWYYAKRILVRALREKGRA